VEEAFKIARDAAMLRDGAEYKITHQDLNSACRSLAGSVLRSLARKIESKYTWADIVLPADTIRQLEDICNHVKYKNLVYAKWGFEKKLARGKSLSVLFSGHSGTGKTMAAEIMAAELQLDIYKIDLSLVVSKYIGETEKNLTRIFEEAEESNVILFFDEADALFGKRLELKDAHDKYSNTEINHLLQLIEDYQGVMTILATNLKKNMDEAFLRRLNFLVDFPAPDESMRYLIWKKMLTGDAPLGEDLDLEYLSKQFNITGGNIKNVVINSAFLAAAQSESISMKHLVLAVKRELAKMGRIASKSDFGKHQHLLD
jgi:SpoVK/Ycf46/Vps4 family AAA+-type ATPase